MMNMPERPESGPSSEPTGDSLGAQEAAGVERAADEAGTETPDVPGTEEKGAPEQEAGFETTRDVRERRGKLSELAEAIETRYGSTEAIPSELQEVLRAKAEELDEAQQEAEQAEERRRKKQEEEERRDYEKQLKEI